MKTNLYNIAYGCPKLDRDENCPLLELDHLSFKERVIKIDEFDDEKIEVMLKHHAYCTKKNGN